MPLEIARGGQADACERCGNNTLPVARIILTDEESLTLPMCVLCLAEAIQIVTTWNMTAAVLAWLRRGDAIARFRQPEKQTRKSRYRKYAPSQYARPKLENGGTQSD